MIPEPQILVRGLTLAPISATIATPTFSGAAIAKAVEKQAVEESTAIPLDHAPFPSAATAIGEIESGLPPADRPEEPAPTPPNFWDKEWLSLNVKTWAWISGGVFLFILILIIVFASLKRNKK